VGIGGAGMSGLALVAHALGAEVTGSDRAESSYTERLRGAGLDPVLGHAAANVPDGAELVVSTAIPPDNPELEHATAAGLVVVHRGALLAEVANLKRSIAVAGAHGKTTTAAMITHILRGAGRDPAFVIGGELREAGTNAAWAQGDWIVVEADESDRSFLELSPDVGVITNIELDHHATYESAAELEAAFSQFAASSAEVVREGALGADDVELQAGGSSFAVEGVPVRLRVPGAHNVSNALAAMAAARAAGLDVPVSAPLLGDFPGTGRRFEARGKTTMGALVYDDYAHHPTELRATIEAARTMGARRVLAAFQPHLYSRTRHLAKEFGEALALADGAVVVDIYPARESAEDFPGVSGRLVAAATARAGSGRPVWWLPRIEDAAAALAQELGEGDLLLTLGAGNIDDLARRLVA
jgi:UDP-N-acetylmuramate--alanine ligase